MKGVQLEGPDSPHRGAASVRPRRLLESILHVIGCLSMVAGVKKNCVAEPQALSPGSMGIIAFQA